MATYGDEPISETRDTLIEAALPNVVFDGWSKAALEAACEDTGIDAQTAAMAFPRGGVDMALAFHGMMDRRLAEDLAGVDLSAMRIRERVTFCVKRRLELVSEHKDAVRRGASLLALPPYAGESTKALWSTADVIWSACGDRSDDYNWYTKRAILSSVYSATVLYWLGDESEGSADTWAFLDRRIENVMQFEKLKGQVKSNPLARMALAPLSHALSFVKPPHARAAKPGDGPLDGAQPAEG
ncbi:MAG: COQ9 family protein [Pseudomonadota bacterium]